MIKDKLSDLGISVMDHQYNVDDKREIEENLSSSTTTPIYSPSSSSQIISE